jgi:photosystem II stability/assembly factor-like uncharacterized protein
MRRAHTLLLAAAAIAAGIVVLSCRGPLVFVCTTDASCNRDGVIGKCTQAPTGSKYCALPDNTTCSGGFKWDDTAGDGLSGMCVLGGGGGDMAGADFANGGGNDMAIPPILTFRTVNSNTTADFYGLGGWAPTNELWVVGPAGIFYLKGDGTFQDVSPPPGDAADGSSIWWYSVAAVGPGEAFVSCDSGDMFHTSDMGATWSHADAGTTDVLAGTWGVSPQDVVAVGRNGAVSHTINGGALWTYSQIDMGNNHINGIWGDSATDLWVAGTRGVIYRSANDGGQWNLQSTGATSDFFAIWGLDSTHIWAAGDSQVTYKYDGQGWTQVRAAQPMQNNMYPSFNGLWASGANDVYAAGVDNTFAGVIFHSTDGTNFTQTSYAGGAVYGIWGFSSTLVYAVGPNGLILKGTP